MWTIICSHSKCPEQPVLLRFFVVCWNNFVLKKSFRNTFRFSNGLDPDPDQVGADLGPNYLRSKIIDKDLNCLFDKAEFTTNCSTLNESSIYFIFLLFFIIVVVCWLFVFKINFFQNFFQEHC